MKLDLDEIERVARAHDKVYFNSDVVLELVRLARLADEKPPEDLPD